MPTAGRLISAIAFAALGYAVAFTAIPLFEEGRAPGFLIWLSTAIGIWAGWVVCGKRSGRGYMAGIGNGITAALALAFWIVFAVAFVDMYKQAIRKLYDGPMEAIVDVFSLMVDYGKTLADPNLIGLVLIGGAAAGLFAEFFARRWS